ncbi:EVE domain-containing protein [Streptomyces sp. SID10815]|nr:EVE domain-containing protein [Streptomyces sp. SID10815]NEA49278.1 EVE domain-containing protein [Streptomyces sp. SID10815]
MNRPDELRARTARRRGEGGSVGDWIYILDPNKDTVDGEPSGKETIHRLAQEEPELDLWLSRRNRMSPGDRLWFFFSRPESAVAAVAEVDAEPYEDPADPEFPYRVEATLLPEATDALYGSPVGREELGLGQVRSVQKVKPEALSVLLARAGL